MKINVTAGDCLNEILQKRYPTKRFIPFREAMIKGGYSSSIFSPGFLEERAKVHGVTTSEYTHSLKEVLDLLENVNKYQTITLWFGEEPFCQANVTTLIQGLKDYGFKGEIILNLVIEETGEIIQNKKIQ